MSSNTLSLTNVRDGIFNNLYLINEYGGLDDIKDIVSSGSSGSAPTHNPTFTGILTVPAITLNGENLSQKC